MMTGFVNTNREAVIRFSVCDRRGQAQEIQAVIDTGFNGYLTLPDTAIDVFGLSYHSRTIVTLGDGSDCVLRQYEATVVWSRQEREVLVLAAEGDPLVGMAMLYGYDVFLRIVDGGVVTIQATSSELSL